MCQSTSLVTWKWNLCELREALLTLSIGLCILEMSYCLWSRLSSWVSSTNIFKSFSEPSTSQEKQQVQMSFLVFWTVQILTLQPWKRCVRWFDPNPTPDLVLFLFKTGAVVFSLPVSIGSRENEWVSTCVASRDPEFKGTLLNSKFSILVSSIHQGHFKAFRSVVLPLEHASESLRGLVKMQVWCVANNLYF